MPWTHEERLPVWPRPRRVSVGSGTAVVQAKAPLFQLAAGGCCKELLEAALRRAERRLSWAQGVEPLPLPHLRVRATGVREDGTPPERRQCERAPSAVFGTLSVEVLSSAPSPLQFGADESYTLELAAAGGGGVLRARSEWGVLHGLETFTSLVQWDGEQLVLCNLPLTLNDAPEFSWRGLLLDTARHYLPLESAIMPLLDGMAALKLNVLHWHICDASAFPFGSEVLPALPARGAYAPSTVYSPTAMRAVVAAAAARGIRVVPELDMPAHAASWGHGLPEIVVHCPARVAADREGLEHGVNKAALNPLNDKTYTAIEAIIGELASIFPDAFLHLGGDEVDGECWRSDDTIAKWASKHAREHPSSEWKHALQALFTERVLRITRAASKRVVMWDEALEFTHLLPATELGEGGLVVDVWRDWLRDHKGRELRDRALLAGNGVVWSSLSWYLDLNQNTWESMYQVAVPSSSRSPASLFGGETSSWGEHADASNLQQRILTRAAAVAERLWSGTPSELDVARQRLAALRCRLLQQRGLRASPVIPDHCAGGRPATDDAVDVPSDDAYMASVLAEAAKYAVPTDRGAGEAVSAPSSMRHALAGISSELDRLSPPALIAFSVFNLLLVALAFCAGLRCAGHRQRKPKGKAD